MPTVLVVEDDDAARRLAVTALAQEHHDVLEAPDAAAATTALANESVDLVVLDLGLPDRPGLDLLTDLQRDNVGVVILTGRGDVEDRIVGLRLGADDYLVKPFAPGELNARVEAVLRRRWPEDQRRLLSFERLVIDLSAREVEVDGQQVDLTPIEFDLLAHLAEHPRRAFTRERLLEDVWKSSSEWQVTTTVTEHIRKLRAKLASVAGDRRWITTVRGVGYRFDP